MSPTPEERARAALYEWRNCGVLRDADLIERVAKAIRAAIAEEREACAKLSESRRWESNAAECSGECADDIARAIRGRP